MVEGELDLGDRGYPQTWYLVDVVDRELRVLGHEVVDLSPGAIELRRCARDLRDFADERERWMAVEPRTPVPRLEERHRRRLSFGPLVAYCVEHDRSNRIHGGRPFRHLTVRFASRLLSPATSAEIGLYFYGRRPAVFGFTSRKVVHGYVGLDWEPLEGGDVSWLLEREVRGEASE